NSNNLQSWVVKELFGKTANSIPLTQRESLDRHLASLFEARPAPLPRALDGGVVDFARAKLIRTPLDQRVYSELKKRLTRNDPSPFRISDAAGRSAPLVFSRKSGKPLNEGLNTLYTFYGYHELFLPKSEQLTQQLANTSWVLGEQYQISTSDNEFELLRHRVHRRYLDDFVLHWRQLLADLTIQPFTSLEHAVEVLGIVSSEQSPLLQLLSAVEKETSLFPATEQMEPGGQIGGTWDSVKKRWRDLTTSLKNNSPEELGRFDTARVTAVFNELNKLVHQSGEAPPPVKGLIALLNELYLELTSLTQTSSEALVQVKRKQIGLVLNRVQNSAKQYPYPLDSMLTAITGDSASLIQGNVCQHIQNSWQSKVLEFCNLAIANRYPIVQAQKQEITPEDFGRFFRQDGMVDQFFQQYLAANVDRSQPKWLWVQQDDSEACVSENSLRQFKRAQNIKNSFFGLGSQTPSLGFSLKPISMSPEVTHLNLTIDGQQLSYAHGPVITTPMTWPGPANTGQVSLQLLPRLAGRISSLSFESPWALFRLFDQATISRGARSEQFLLDFSIGKRNVRFDLRASSAINPFKLNDLNYFRCPRQL
ncbi:MAG: type VI secretion system membrane subunit TssM, partial [Aestuariibacter sp.]|nr:type VI secretion system membrane subunit TssM [Aestuariibacter sp.]